MLQLCSITQHNRASKYPEPTTCKVTMGWHATYPNQLAIFCNKWHLRAKVGNISWLVYSPEKKTECCRNLCSADLSNFCSNICYLYTVYWTWPESRARCHQVHSVPYRIYIPSLKNCIQDALVFQMVKFNSALMKSMHQCYIILEQTNFKGYSFCTKKCTKASHRYQKWTSLISEKAVT